VYFPNTFSPTPRITLAQAFWLLGVIHALAREQATSERAQSDQALARGWGANGNVEFVGSNPAASWTTFNQPMALPSAAAANTTTSFKYGADYERRQETIPLPGGGTMERFMLHAGAATFYEEDVKAGFTTDQRAYLTGPAGPVGVLESRINVSGANISTTQRYWHRDHLGSTTVNSDETGAEVGRYRYDPWGKPLSGNLTANAVGTGNRGFTGHEHLVGGLIHMNGPLLPNPYDPVLGRFLSADIVVQMPHNVQSYNRYSYVLNNPLSYTDPSGYFFWFAVAALFGAFAYATGGVQFARQVLGIAAAILFGPAGPYAAAMATFFGGSFASAVFAGFASGGISSGNIQGAFRGAASAALFFGAGSLADGLAASAGAEAGAATGAPFDSSDFASASAHGSANSIAASGGIGRAGLHAIAGCIGALGGGKCGAGALSAAFGELAGPMIPGGKVEGLIGRAIVGGISAELGGGKFANGAMTASFGYLFNELAHSTSCQQRGHNCFSLSADGRAAIQKHEGFRLTVYDDGAGFPTVGWGHLVLPSDALGLGETISRQRAEQLFDQDIARFISATNRLIPFGATQSQFDATVSLMYNIGESAFSRSTLLKSWYAGDFDAVSSNWLDWNRAGGKVWPGLTRRREDELRTFRK
jgi:RHS repeat-associated protein